MTNRRRVPVSIQRRMPSCIWGMPIVVLWIRLSMVLMTNPAIAGVASWTSSSTSANDEEGVAARIPNGPLRSPLVVPEGAPEGLFIPGGSVHP